MWIQWLIIKNQFNFKRKWNVYKCDECVNHQKGELSQSYSEITGFSKVLNREIEKSVSVDEMSE